MSAERIESLIRRRYSIRLNPAKADEPSEYDVLLRPALDGAGSQLIVVYRLEKESVAFTTLSLRSRVAAKYGEMAQFQSADASEWLENLTAPATLHADQDHTLDMFPESRAFGLRRMLVVPLRSERELFGLATFGRVGNFEYSAQAVRHAEEIGYILTAMIERDLLRAELDGRKVIERAKGILQKQKRITEESAYLMMRTASRKRRAPMVEIAREIVGAG